MRKRSDLHSYQVSTAEAIKKKRNLALFLGLGAGKTVTALTAIADLYDEFSVDRVLVIAPLRVANSVWHTEAKQWEHTKDLTFAIATGKPSDRINALNAKAVVTVINRENVKWLVDHYGGKFPFKMVVIDESSSFKNPTSQRFRAMKKVVKLIDRCVLLTATPSPNGYLDLWSQFYLLDGGGRLGYNITSYRNSYFIADYMGYNYQLKYDAAKQIEYKISDIVISAKYDELPDYVSIEMENLLSGKLLKEYQQFEQEAIISLKGVELNAVNAATLTNKLLQYASGAIYDEHQNVINIHSLKMDMLDEIIEFNPDEPILVAYNYKHELDRLQTRYPYGEVIDKGGKNIERWNKGEIKMLFVHPQSAGHGIQLQGSGHILVWYGLTWSLEGYQQLIGRIHRQGQKNIVNVIHLITAPIEQKVVNVLNSKGVTQNELLAVLKGL